MSRVILFFESQWKAFETEKLPEKPDADTQPERKYFERKINYPKEIAALKAKALPIQNPEVIDADILRDAKQFGKFIEWTGRVEKKKTEPMIKVMGQGYQINKGIEEVYILIPPNSEKTI